MTKTIIIRVDDKLKREINELAKKEYRSLSNLLRKIIIEYIKKELNQKKEKVK